MKSLNNFQNALASVFKVFSHYSTVILHFSWPKHKFQNIGRNFFHPLFSGKKSRFWHNSGAESIITQPTKIWRSRYIAGLISDNISRWVFSEVKYWPKNDPFKQLDTLFCALAYCNHHAMTAPFEYRGSQAGNALVSPSVITWIGASMSQKSVPKQPKLWFGLKYKYAAPIWSPHSKLHIN